MMMNKSFLLCTTGLIVTGLGAMALSMNLSNGNDIAITMCLGVFFFGIQILYDGIKSYIGSN